MRALVALAAAYVGCGPVATPPAVDAATASDASGCPAVRPAGGSACALGRATACTYGVTECGGSARTAHVRCACEDGGWACGCATM